MMTEKQGSHGSRETIQCYVCMNGRRQDTQAIVLIARIDPQPLAKSLYFTSWLPLSLNMPLEPHEMVTNNYCADKLIWHYRLEHLRLKE